MVFKLLPRAPCKGKVFLFHLLWMEVVAMSKRTMPPWGRRPTSVPKLFCDHWYCRNSGILDSLCVLLNLQMHKALGLVVALLAQSSPAHWWIALAAALLGGVISADLHFGVGVPTSLKPEDDMPGLLVALGCLLLPGHQACYSPSSWAEKKTHADGCGQWYLLALNLRGNDFHPSSTFLSSLKNGSCSFFFAGILLGGSSGLSVGPRAPFLLSFFWKDTIILALEGKTLSPWMSILTIYWMAFLWRLLLLLLFW